VNHCFLLVLCVNPEPAFPDKAKLRVNDVAQATFDELPKPGIGASGVIARIRQRENILVLANGEPLDLAELRVLQSLGQQFQVVLWPCLLAGKSLAEAFDKAGWFGLEVEGELVHEVLNADFIDEQRWELG
jgi:hypothetical protein